MKKLIALTLACLTLAACLFVPSTAKAACGANGDEYEFFFTEEVNFIFCDAYELYENDPYLYEFPIAIPQGCTSSLSTNSCELNGTLSCEVEPNPYSGGRTWWSSTWHNVELVDNGGGTLDITVEDEWGGFICFLQYDVYVSEI